METNKIIIIGTDIPTTEQIATKVAILMMEKFDDIPYEIESSLAEDHVVINPVAKVPVDPKYMDNLKQALELNSNPIYFDLDKTEMATCPNCETLEYDPVEKTCANCGLGLT